MSGRTHADMMESFYAARETHANAREVALGYKTEEAEFHELHPRPRLRDFMRQQVPDRAETSSHEEPDGWDDSTPVHPVRRQR